MSEDQPDLFEPPPPYTQDEVSGYNLAYALADLKSQGYVVESISVGSSNSFYRIRSYKRLQNDL